MMKCAIFFLLLLMSCKPNKHDVWAENMCRNSKNNIKISSLNISSNRNLIITLDNNEDDTFRISLAKEQILFDLIISNVGQKIVFDNAIQGRGTVNNLSVEDGIYNLIISDSDTYGSAIIKVRDRMIFIEKANCLVFQ